MELSENKLSVKVGELGLTIIMNLFFFTFYGAFICGCHFHLEACLLALFIVSFNLYIFIKGLKKEKFKILNLLLVIIWISLEIIINSKNLLN